MATLNLATNYNNPKINLVLPDGSTTAIGNPPTPTYESVGSSLINNKNFSLKFRIETMDINPTDSALYYCVLTGSNWEVRITEDRERSNGDRELRFWLVCNKIKIYDTGARFDDDYPPASYFFAQLPQRRSRYWIGKNAWVRENFQIYKKNGQGYFYTSTMGRTDIDFESLGADFALQGSIFAGFNNNANHAWLKNISLTYL